MYKLYTSPTGSNIMYYGRLVCDTGLAHDSMRTGICRINSQKVPSSQNLPPRLMQSQALQVGLAI